MFRQCFTGSRFKNTIRSIRNAGNSCIICYMLYREDCCQGDVELVVEPCEDTGFGRGEMGVAHSS